MFKVTRLSGLGVVVGLVGLASLFLPWWSIRALGVSIDVYPFRVMAWNVPSYDVDWVVDRLLGLDSTLLVVGVLVVVSSVMVAVGVGSVRLRLLLIAPFVLNLAAAFLFLKLVYSAIGKLAFGSFSGTNLIAAGPWGFGVGIGVCVLAGIGSLFLLGLSCLSYFRPER